MSAWALSLPTTTSSFTLNNSGYLSRQSSWSKSYLKQKTHDIYNLLLHLARKRNFYIFLRISVDSYQEGRKEMFYLTTHSTHFIYGYVASDICERTIQIVREETCFVHMGYSFQLAARVLLYAQSHRQDSTYHSFCCTSRGALAGTEIAQWVLHEGSIRRFIAPRANALTTELHLTPIFLLQQSTRIIQFCLFAHTYFRAYIHLRFKNAVLGTHLSNMGCLSRTVT